jgi:hypothetical protein
MFIFYTDYNLELLISKLNIFSDFRFLAIEKVVSPNLFSRLTSVSCFKSISRTSL